MALHPLAARFAAVAGEYERGRPDYAPAVVGAIAAELGIPPGAAVLDLAAGTGKLTRVLLGMGLDVVAVEPQPSLREILAANVGGERVRAGVAEAIPLPDSSVAAVTVADAFHWLDRTVALGEIRRVLRPRGGLAILTTVPDWSGASWAHELGALMASLRPEHPHFDGPPWQDSVRAAQGWTAPREIRLTTAQPATAERVLDYIASTSWIAALPDERRAEGPRPDRRLRSRGRHAAAARAALAHRADRARLSAPGRAAIGGRRARISARSERPSVRPIRGRSRRTGARARAAAGADRGPPAPPSPP